MLSPALPSAAMTYTRAELEAMAGELHMDGGFGGINPTIDQLVELFERGGDGPVQMINLLKFKPRAEYPPGTEDLGGTGEEAYQRYGINTLPHVTSRGGRLTLLAVADSIVLGDMGHDDWDQVAIMEYPTRDAFIDMGRDPDYQAGTVHRTAGLERSAIIAVTPIIDASAPPQP